MRIVLYPDPVLTKKARAITPDELKAGQADGIDLRELAARMIATMYEADGIGLAAPQVGVSLRFWVADPSPEHTAPLAIVNPVLSNQSGTLDMEEGCLSIPEVRGKVKRFQKLTVTGLDLDGNPVTLEAEDLAARVAQHETDHLDGILFITKIGTAARFMARSKLRVLEDEYEVMQRRRKK
ncbi:MAG: peptide deformylase [Planctomycetota bacterium]|nr:peptide deformylase [Planctomycetota bacterium]